MNITVVGLGLIGGSFAKALRAYTSHTVLGWDRDGDIVAKALADGGILGVLQGTELEAQDLVLVALPPKATADFILKHCQNFKKGAIVVDVCGIKEYIYHRVYQPLKAAGVVYLGAHPMAGKEVSGYQNASAQLFCGASLILTPQETWQSDATATVSALCLQLGFGGIAIATPKRHDQIIAYTSQLAHVVSSAYVKSPTIAGRAGFSAGSFQDLTRVAVLDPDLWADLMCDNRTALLAELDNLMQNLAQYRNALDSEDRTALFQLLQDGRDKKLADLATIAKQNKIE